MLAKTLSARVNSALSISCISIWAISFEGEIFKKDHFNLKVVAESNKRNRKFVIFKI